jgi:hypothetical protein
VLEHAGHGDLLKLVRSNGGLAEDKAQILFGSQNVFKNNKRKSKFKIYTYG